MLTGCRTLFFSGVKQTMPSIQECLKGKLVVSCQASPGDPLDDAETIRRIARASVKGGAAGLRINSPEHITAIRRDSDIPIIGIQKQYRNGQLHITPDFASALALAAAGASIIALDCTDRASSEGKPWRELIERIHRDLKLPVMADIATLHEALAAEAAGADFVGTTLNGYTEQTRNNHSFSWSLLSSITRQIRVPVIAEGHISTPEEARHALSLGAFCVVVGSAITRPGVITANFVRSMNFQSSISPAVGVDIGGTSIKAALVERDGEVKFPIQVPTDAGKGRNAIVANLTQAIDHMLTVIREHGIQPVGLGIASAGAINTQDGSVFAATENLPEWTGFNLREFAEKRFHFPTCVINDAHAAVLAELRFGFGQVLSDFAVITVGTGIGGGIVSAGKLLLGQHGFAGTLGHHVIRMNGLPCNCGRQGCLEAYVSSAALLREYAEQGGSIPKEFTDQDGALAFKISQLAIEGDPTARRAYTAMAEYLAEGIANIFNIFDPQAVFISGGLVEGQTLFVADVQNLVRNLLHFGSLRKPRVQLAKAGHYAGVQGAGARVFEEFRDIRTSPCLAAF
jgi:glucokinase-like ROK family protein